MAHMVKKCPECGGINLFWNKEKGEVICKDCGLVIEDKMIDMSALLEAATLSILRAVWLMDTGKPNNVESSVCKAKGGDVARKCLQKGVELMGALGITHDTLAEKLFRDARVGR